MFVTCTLWKFVIKRVEIGDNIIQWGRLNVFSQKRGFCPWGEKGHGTAVAQTQGTIHDELSKYLILDMKIILVCHRGSKQVSSEIREGPSYQCNINVNSPDVNVHTILPPTPAPQKKPVLEQNHTLVYFDLETTSLGW